jgi:hypothetical protein
VENLISRLRTYFTLRRYLGGSCLDLLRFFLNHRHSCAVDVRAPGQKPTGSDDGGPIPAPTGQPLPLAN